jgi:omega-amidase
VTRCNRPLDGSAVKLLHNDMPPEANPLRVGLGQYDIGWEQPPMSLDRARRVVERAVAAGAQLVLLPEMCTTGFTMDATQWTEPVDGRSVTALQGLAREHGVHIVAGVATREGAATYNSALLIDETGAIVTEYRKQRLFPIGGEDRSYRPGLSAVTAVIRGVRVAIMICFDLRFSELFLAVAPHVDAILLIANWPVTRREHWDVLVRARAIESQCALAAVNRIGRGGGADYDGGSVVYGPWGELLCAVGDGDAAETAFIADIDPAEVARVRMRYPFLQRPAATST